MWKMITAGQGQTGSQCTRLKSIGRESGRGKTDENYANQLVIYVAADPEQATIKLWTKSSLKTCSAMAF